jgi:hypothetical protein
LSLGLTLLLVGLQEEDGQPAFRGPNSHAMEFLNSRTSWQTWHIP